jgi:glyoxylase-like metal-dependent hydrolase (beta-lactamase superfamily II)
VQIQQDYLAATGHHIDIVFAQGQNHIHFPFTKVHDNQLLSLGKHHIRVIHTPGHTMESACYLFNNRFLLTGDTLFLGDVGRPDLVAGGDPSLTKEIMADHLYSSLQRLKEELDD